MKFLKTVLSLALGAATLLSVGCNKKTYSFYTNIPQGGYSLTDKNFKLGGFIEGYTQTESSFEDMDTSKYETRGQIYYSMFADALLVVSDDFTADGVEDKYDAFKKAVGNLLDGVSKALSSTVTGSDIYNFNNAEAGTTLEIGKTAYEVLSEAKAAYTLTEGSYNPALYYNVHAYGFNGESTHPQTASELPSDDKISKYTDLAKHFGDVKLKEEDGKFFVTKPAYTVEVEGETLALKLDLSGISKGYAVDLVDALFDEYGYEYGYFSFGTSSMIFKSNAQAGAYRLLLSSPRSIKGDEYIRLPIRGEKLSTSGDSEQYYKIDGVRYCHVLDPETGKPVQKGIMSVTIIGGTAAQDDALTTAIMCMGKERAAQFIKEHLTDRRVVFTCE